ncbi:MAG: AMP-binding protein [Clostridia bacterium]|nr:AMP-binding protein [Clostridia bacterium]
MPKNVLAQNSPELTKPTSIKHLLQIAVDEAADNIAFKYRTSDGIREVTFKEFQTETFYLGTALNSLGLAKGHIGCAAENSYNWILVYLTALQSEGVFCPIDKELPDSDLVNVIHGGDDEVVFCDKKREENFKRIRGQLPNVKYFICFDREEDEGEFLSFQKLFAKGKELYENGDRSYCEMQTADMQALKMLIYTSGTTGLAKGVMLSEHNLVSLVHYGLKLASIREVGLSVLPYHHAYEAVAGILVAIHRHATLCINDSLKRIVKNLALYKPGYMYVVPALIEVLYRRMNASIEEKGKTKTIKIARKLSRFLRAIGIDARRKIFAELHNALGGNLVKLVCGGAPLRAEIADFFDDIGILVTNGYGITECSPLVSVNTDFINDPKTIGFPMECIDVRIDDPNEDEEGEICVKGDIVMLGYYKNEEATAEVFTEDGYFRTGDYGKINKKGQIIITGRKKNIIILGNGKNIYPEELEDYIGSIPYVLENIVYASRDEVGTEAALAVQCVLTDEVLEGADMKELQAKLKHDVFNVLSALPTYKQITNVIIRETPFVKTTTNKIRRAKDGSPM